MMRARSLVLFIPALLCCFNLLYASDSSALDSLWDAALRKNVSIEISKSELKNAVVRRTFYSSLYSPSLVVKGSNDFAPSAQSEDGLLSDASSATLSYNQPFSGGGSFSAGLDYSQTRPVISDRTFVVQSPHVSFAVSQGLHPWWIQGIKKNPQVGLLDTSVLLQEIHLDKQEKNVLIQLTQDYISLRKTERAITLLEKQILSKNESISSLQILYEQGAINMTAIWDEKQKLIDDEALLLLTRNERDRLKGQIHLASGIMPDSVSSCPMPVVQNTHTQNLSDVARNNLEAREIETQIEAISYNKAQQLQNTAPVLNVSADISWPFEQQACGDWDKAWKNAWEDKLDPLYSVTLSIDMSPLLARSNEQNRKIEESNVSALAAKKIAAIASFQNQMSLLTANLTALRSQIEQYRTAYTQTFSLVEDAEKLGRQGAITIQELQSYRNQLEKRRITLADAEDQLWYGEWYIALWLE